MPNGKKSFSSSSAHFFIIMKKILLFFVALLCSFAAAMAQVNYVATLQHGDSITNYYGGGAFEQAYNASEDGDVITLSAGTFSFGRRDFKKGITVRGTGIDAEKKTFISSVVSIFSDDEAKVANIEGIVFNQYVYIVNANETAHGKINLIKNRFASYFITEKIGAPTENGPVVRVYNSIFSYSVDFYRGSNPDVIFYNSYVAQIHSGLTDYANASFINCVCYLADYREPCPCLNFFNCIFTNVYGRELASTCTCYNCITTKGSPVFRNIVSGENNKEVSGAIFKTYTNGYNYGETFELTDEAAETYLGTDGTQVGMQGGTYPYNTTVQYPIITKFESVPQTTKEGMLSIDVQVDGK